MRFHVVGLPHTQTTLAYSSCAYTEKVRKFCVMMHARGHHVTLYAGEENEAPCDEHVVCVSEMERRRFAGGRHFLACASFDSAAPNWRVFNAAVKLEMLRRVQERDFICLIGGHAQKPIADEFPGNMVVEFGVGYAGTFANYKVYESYAWMHTCHGAQQGPGNIMTAYPNWFDAVIPGYVDMSLFPRGKAKREDYVLFVGRLIEGKGINLALDATRRAGKKLVVVGAGVPPTYDCTYFGEVGPEKRADLMSRARCVIAPTLYAEPFGNVVIEAMACGTPVITTDWGAFTETVQHGVTGYRCRMMAEFVNAINLAPSLNHAAIRRYVDNNYSLKVIGAKYEQYFARLFTLWENGFNTE